MTNALAYFCVRDEEKTLNGSNVSPAASAPSSNAATTNASSSPSTDVETWCQFHQTFFCHNWRILIGSFVPCLSSLVYCLRVGRILAKWSTFQLLHSRFGSWQTLTRLERPSRDKHSSLLRTLVNYWRKKFYKTGFRPASLKPWSSVLGARPSWPSETAKVIPSPTSAQYLWKDDHRGV